MLFPLKFIAQARRSLDNGKDFGNEKSFGRDSELDCAFLGTIDFIQRKTCKVLVDVLFFWQFDALR